MSRKSTHRLPRNLYFQCMIFALIILAGIAREPSYLLLYILAGSVMTLLVVLGFAMRDIVISFIPLHKFSNSSLLQGSLRRIALLYAAVTIILAPLPLTLALWALSSQERLGDLDGLFACWKVSALLALFFATFTPEAYAQSAREWMAKSQNRRKQPAGETGE